MFFKDLPPLENHYITLHNYMQIIFSKIYFLYSFYKFFSNNQACYLKKDVFLYATFPLLY